MNEECDKIDLVDDTDSFESSDISETKDNSADDLIMYTITDNELDDDQGSMGIGFNDDQDDRIAILHLMLLRLVMEDIGGS